MNPASSPATSAVSPGTVAAGRRGAAWLFGGTIFLGSALLFQVQPLIGKQILPWFGGASGVWVACLMFFQLMLLGGYLYAHWLARGLGLRQQVVAHAALLLGSLALLPIAAPAAWRQAALDPTLRVVLLLGSTIGLPYLLLAATSPLLQSWYAGSGAGPAPYRLFAVSNVGSAAALLSYPVLVEPQLSGRAQSLAWSAAYVGFGLLCCATGWRAARAARGRAAAPAPDEVAAAERAAGAPRRAERLWCVLSAACGSGLLVAVTTHLSQNVAPVPLLWVLPLAAYLASFVLCFESEGVYRRAVWVPACWVALAAMATSIYRKDGLFEVGWLATVYVAGLLLCCMVCHGEIARRKPHPRFLTGYYLAITGGGALGGMLVAVAAPRMFRTYAEMPVLLVGCAVLATAAAWKGFRRPVFAYAARIAAVAGCVALAGYLGWNKREYDQAYFHIERNFYGVLKVRDDPETEETIALRTLANGTIEHGSQLISPAVRRTPTSYYGPSSGVGLAVQTLQERGATRVGVVGLGAGVMASYCRPGDVYRFYEINPAVVRIARTQFWFLQDCPGTVEVEVEDARLAMERQAPQQFDLLAIDAFTGDAIPVHLLTLEAFREYFRHLRGDGILAVHVSNRYVDLEPVVARAAEALGKRALVVDHEAGEDPDAPGYVSDSTWILLASTQAPLDAPVFQRKGVTPSATRPGIALWTDQYSNLFRALR